MPWRESCAMDERMRSLLEAMTPPEPDLAAQLRRFARFARDYNEERPHEVLGQRTPASAYAPSARPMPKRIAEPDYPPKAAARRVRSNGEIRWQGDLMAVSTALAGEAVAVEETEDGQWLVRFYDTPIDLIDPEKKRLRRLAVPAAGGSEMPDETKL
jgi:putative transposase